jgi:hypothetical protein
MSLGRNNAKHSLKQIYLYNAAPRRTAKMPVANAKNNAMNT